MDTDDFARQFAELLADPASGQPGPPPFPWQVRLWSALVAGQRVSALDLPTGLGKTSVIAIWLLARAAGASLPRRLAYVVDRRVVVDQATEYAERLRANLTPATAKALGLSAGQALPISTLRGGYADAGEWLANPALPAVVVGTVDMIGSRLLFEGYGVSRRMRPFHAGLLGADTLFALDEAHLSTPFERLLKQVTNRRSGARLGPPPQLMTLSATGASASGDDLFQLDAKDLEHPVVSQRLGAHKALSLRALGDAKPDQIAAEALELAVAAGGTPRVLVFLNSRTTAMKVAASLRTRLKPSRGSKEAAATVELLTGGRRAFERDAAAKRLAALGFLAGHEPAVDAPAFLVATSAGEVGIDLDADAMLCDLVPFERIVQRLGRVNRRGEGQSVVYLLDTRPPPKNKQSDKEKADRARLDSTLKLLSHLPQSTGETQARDASPAALGVLRAQFASQALEAATPAPLHPALESATLEAWSLTSLVEHAGRPEVAPWLRGWVDEDPQTEVVWRTVLPLPVESAARDLDAFLADTPVHPSERLQLATDEVASWLFKRARAQPPDESGASLPVACVALDAGLDRTAHWSLDELHTIADSSTGVIKSFQRQLFGATLLVDARLRGLSDGLLDATCVEDVVTAEFGFGNYADDAPTPMRPRVPWTLSRWAGDSAPKLADSDNGDTWLWVRRYATRLSSDGVPTEGVDVWRWRHEPTSESSRAYGATTQSLVEHSQWAREEAEHIAAALGLEAWLRDAIVTAAFRHDSGKDCARWQDAMNAPREGRPFAKTRGGGNPHALAGYRHEFGSLLDALNDDEISALPGATRDLVLHLIAAHHGHARPWLSPEGAPHLPPSALSQHARDAALRFLALQDAYDPWGIAWAEALMRAADQRASARLERQVGG